MDNTKIEATLEQLIRLANYNARKLESLTLAVENLALQTTNNQVENKKTLDAIKTGVLDTNLAVKFPNV